MNHDKYSIKTIDSEMLYKGKILNLRKDIIETESNKKAVREIVEHKPPVAIVPIDDNKNVLLVRQYRHPAKQYLLEVPAGLIEDGEKPDIAAMRELREKIWLFFKKPLGLLGGFWPSPGFTDEYMYCYFGTDLKENRLPADKDENIEVESTPINRINKLFKILARLLMQKP
ncbi:MAG: ADP-ribose pyrophosphatase [Chloroflexota bacterium]|nr:MAG: ADP-ribose pyrophosphatase [Chloroflexota bacterium]